MSLQEDIHYIHMMFKGPESLMVEGLHCSNCVQGRTIACYISNESFCLGKTDPWEVEKSIPVNMSLRTATFGVFMLKRLDLPMPYKFNSSFKSLALLTCITKIPADAVPPDKWQQRLDFLHICSLAEFLSNCWNWLSPWTLSIESQFASLDQTYWLSGPL